MWRRFYNRRGQSTGEYALVFAIILGAVVAMQTYVKRGLQGRIKEGADYMARETTDLGSATQYEPYYYGSDYSVTRSSDITRGYVEGESETDVDKEQTTREAGGHTEYSESQWQDVFAP